MIAVTFRAPTSSAISSPMRVREFPLSPRRTSTAPDFSAWLTIRCRVSFGNEKEMKTINSGSSLPGAEPGVVWR
jgi:hypothetical protein